MPIHHHGAHLDPEGYALLGVSWGLRNGEDAGTNIERLESEIRKATGLRTFTVRLQFEPVTVRSR